MSSFLNNPLGEKQIRLHDNPIQNVIELYLLIEDKSALWFAQHIEFIELEEGKHPDGPTEMFTHTEAQNLFNELWRLGFRPSKGYQEGAEAMQKHLNDMRKIVSSTLKIDL